MIRFEQVSKTYPGGFRSPENVSFQINKGEMIFIAGLRARANPPF